jgi:hypothetical protein
VGVPIKQSQDFRLARRCIIAPRGESKVTTEVGDRTPIVTGRVHQELPIVSAPGSSFRALQVSLHLPLSPPFWKQQQPPGS